MIEDQLIKRPGYTNQIAPFIGKNIIKILTGQRRVGKSFILKQLMEEIKSKNARSNVIYIDKELEEFSNLKNNKDLHKYVSAHLLQDKDNYLFIDEVQEIQSFELVSEVSSIKISVTFFVLAVMLKCFRESLQLCLQVVTFLFLYMG